MAQYIDKDALVAEITKIYDRNRSNGFLDVCDEIDDILSFIDALEVKEVDLEKELSYEDYKSFFEKYPDLSDDWGFEEAWTFAQYFFELGLKAQKGKEV